MDDDDEEADDDEEEQELAEGFIENEDAGGLSPSAIRDDRQHRELDQKQNLLAEEDAQKLAAGFRERYGRSNGTYRGDNKTVPQRLLLPSVDDPSIWSLRCRSGKESEIIFNLLRKQADLEGTPNELRITSIFYREHLEGYIYVEARKQKDVMEALQDVVNIYTNKLVLVPVKEMPDLLRIRKQGTTLVPGTYVRVRKNNKRYAGDLGRILNLDGEGTQAFVQLVPRLDYKSAEDLMRKTLASTADRPPPRLFNASDVEKLTQQRPRGNPTINKYEFLGETFEDGFLIKSLKIKDLIIEDVQPTLEEMQAFSGDDTVDLAGLSLGLKQRQTAFAIGDSAEVFAGEQAGVHGIVESFSNGIVELRTVDHGLGLISVPVSGLRKKFFAGNHVRVQRGTHVGEAGMVVAVNGNNVTLMSDLGMREITVFSSDLGEISEVSGPQIQSRFEVRDVVKLNAIEVGCVIKLENDKLRVLMPNGDIRTIQAGSIISKIEPSKRARTADKHGQSIQIAEPQSTVREIGGQHRKGKVFNLYLSFVFAFNIEMSENNGVFIALDRNVEIDGMSVAKFDTSKQNPALRMNGMAPPTSLPKSVGRDRAIGQTIWIRRGPQKGVMGIITDTTDTTARLELHTSSKKISVNKDLLGFRLDPSGPLVGYAEFISSKPGWRPAAGMPTRDPSDANRPLWAQSGARTPAGGSLGSYNTGSKTPAWAGTGSRTPAWQSSLGSATPAWAGTGSRTPAYGAGNQTPAWNANGGSKTPAWQTGSATPAWTASATPRAQSYGSATPSWAAPAGAKTPSWNSAPTPRASNYGQTLPRDTYTTPSGGMPDYAPTPGVSQGWEEEWRQTSAPAAAPALTDDFINPARMAQMQHSAPTPSAWAAPTPGYLPPSP